MDKVKKRFSREAKDMDTAILYLLISVFFSTIGQLLLKSGMNSIGAVTLDLDQIFSTLWRMIINPGVFFGLSLYLVGTIFWLAALSRVNLSYAYPFASLSYVIMLLASWTIFDEKITLSRMLGTAVIGIGVLILSRQ